MVTVLAFKPTYLGTHDASACLIRDGSIVAAAEEERFCRRKHARNLFPAAAIRYCLGAAGASIDELDAIGIPYDPRLYWRFVPGFLRVIREARGPIDRLALLGVALTRLGFAGWGPGQLRRLLQADRTPARWPPIRFVPHHLSHAAAAFFCSGFDQAAVMTIDGVGEYDSSVLWRVEGGRFQRLQTFASPNSLGRFYSLFTEYLGFERLDGEGKLMALAPYGERDPGLERFFDRFVGISGDGYNVGPLLRRFPGPEHLEGALGVPRIRRGDPLTDRHRNLAWHVQQFTERAMCVLVAETHRRTGLRKLCLAGGVALNCLANKKVAESPCVEELFVPPIAGDAGLALGCAQLLGARMGAAPAGPLAHASWGPGFGDDAIEAVLRRCRIAYETPADLARVVAAELADDRFVGWFQGRMEMGPRALGHRSILAAPGSRDLADRLNREVKGREPWRPFAPSVLADRAAEWFAGCRNSPFMTRAFETAENRRHRIEGVVHPVDGTARVQTVDARTNERYYQLLVEFERLTGLPVLLNTSFNLAGEPIVCTPEDALGTFFRSGLDLLVLGCHIVRKRRLGPEGDHASTPHEPPSARHEALAP